MPKIQDSPTRFRFTQRELEALPPHDPNSLSAQLELADAECVGLRFNKSKTGRTFWFFRYRYRGRKCAIKIGEFPGMNLKQARERGWEIRGMLSRGEEPRAQREAKASTLLFAEFTEKHYLPQIKASLRRPDVIISRLNSAILPCFKNKYLDAITTKDIQQFHAKLRERMSPTTANHTLATIKAMLNLAVKWEMLQKNPCIGVKKFQEPTGRDRYLTQDEVKRFLKALDQSENIPAICGLRTLLFTGLRCREVFQVKWDDVDMEKKSIYLRQTKSGKARRVYLSNIAWEEILRMKEFRKDKHPFVFPGKFKDKPVLAPRYVFENALKIAGIRDFHVHDLRHTFASHMVQSGATLFEVQKSLGHSTSVMTQRYAHLADSDLTLRAEQTGQRLTGTDK